MVYHRPTSHIITHSCISLHTTEEIGRDYSQRALSTTWEWRRPPTHHTQLPDRWSWRYNQQRYLCGATKVKLIVPSGAPRPMLAHPRGSPAFSRGRALRAKHRQCCGGRLTETGSADLTKDLPTANHGMTHPAHHQSGRRWWRWCSSPG